MRNLRTLCASVVLALVLTTPAFAGDMHTGITNPPPAQQGNIHTGVTDSPTQQGDIHTGVAESEPEAGTVTEIALNLLQSLLSLF